MFIKSFYTSGQNSDKQLYDRLFFTELGLKEITNNDEIMIDFTSKIEDVIKMKTGYTLFSIDIKKKHHVILICKSERYGEGYNFCYIMNEDKDIDAGTLFKLEEQKDYNLYDFVAEKAKGSSLDELDVISLVLTKTMLGYRVNTSKVIDVIEKMARYESKQTSNVSTELIELANASITSITEAKTEVINKFNQLKEKFELPIIEQLNLTYIISGRSDTQVNERYYSYRPPVVIAKIDDVYNINNKRYALVSIFKPDAPNQVEREVFSYRVTNNKPEMLLQHDDYRVFKSQHTYDHSLLGSIDYNYIDKGRYVSIYGAGGSYKAYTIFQDPRIKDVPMEQLINYNTTVINSLIKDNIDISNCSISIDDEKGRNLTLLLSKYTDNHQTVTYKTMQKAMKSMYNEYNYVIKKNKSEGDDVKITDNLTYYHDTGKLEYNDFAIEVSLESLKQTIYDRSKEYMVSYFRKEVTEEEIINKLTALIYQELDYFVNATSVEHSFTVKFNNSVVVAIDICKGGNNFTYINDNRINKNEISSILTEISCYNSQEAADIFIKNITKRGLSVFIGLSSGYFHGDKYYKFKTSDKSGEYTMNIDGIEVNIKGKKIFNTLFSVAFRNERQNNRSRISDNEYINNHVFSSVKSKFDYIKYKIMIDKSYQLFIEKSKNFLNKKIEDVGAERVKYLDKNQGKEYDAIKVVGLSGRTYVIAYTLKESFVFMSPEEDGMYDNEHALYTEGTYICMIDQSKMKATVGYDTVVSKLLSLKNDSVIASTIYNLEDELNK